MRSYTHAACRYEITEKLREKDLLHKFFKVTGIISIKTEEKGTLKVVTHMSHLEQLFPKFDLFNLKI